MIVAIILPAHKERGVYKFQYGGKVYYRLGNNVDNARLILQRELRTRPGEIQIMDGGKKQ